MVEEEVPEPVPEPEPELPLTTRKPRLRKEKSEEVRAFFFRSINSIQFFILIKPSTIRSMDELRKNEEL